MVLPQKWQNRFGRAADGRARSGDDDRPLQQDGMLGNRLGDIGFGKIGLLLAQGFEFRLAIADQFLRLAAHQFDQLLDLGLAGRLLEILANSRLYSLFAQQLQRLARLGAAWVVPDGEGHAISLLSITLRARS